MADSALDDLLEVATDHFNEGRYSLAEPILNQIILRNNKRPEVFHMLGSIYYDQGKFNKAIRTFKRAIEIDPSFTDASIGLSVILNDLGRYDEGRKVFEDARKMLAMRSREGDPYVNEKISLKHDELGELYFQHGRIEEAIEQYQKSLELSTRTAEITMHLVKCYFKLDQPDLAGEALISLLKEYPQYVPARVQLGKAYYDQNRVAEAVEEWERALDIDPNNQLANEYLGMAQSIRVTRLDEPGLEL